MTQRPSPSSEDSSGVISYSDGRPRLPPAVTSVSPNIAGQDAWATGFVVCAIAIAMMKVWYWLELNKNSLAREIKRLELELANLSRRLSSASSQR